MPPHERGEVLQVEPLLVEDVEITLGPSAMRGRPIGIAGRKYDEKQGPRCGEE
jgi:hypothetical protein